MEAASVGAGEKNHLQNVLSEQELRNLSAEVISKVNVYIEQTCDDYLTSKALHETGKAQIGISHFDFYTLMTISFIK